jgi:hypothetical protein
MITDALPNSLVFGGCSQLWGHVRVHRQAQPPGPARFEPEVGR